MPKRLEGGYLGAAPTFTRSDRSGLWGIERHGELVRKSIFPPVRSYRYWRMDDFLTPTGGYLDLNEIQFATAADTGSIVSRIADGASAATTNDTDYASGTVANANDDNTGTRVAWDASAISSTSYINIDMGQARAITHWRQNSGGADHRYILRVTIKASDDNSSFTTIGTSPVQLNPGLNTWSAWVPIYPDLT